jgi:hypothetical protein
VEITEFDFDDENEEHIGRHGITTRQLDQVLKGEFAVMRNRSSRRATHIVYGRDFGGACIVIPVVPTAVPGVWRPVTAWYCKTSEWTRLRRGR